MVYFINVDEKEESGFLSLGRIQTEAHTHTDEWFKRTVCMVVGAEISVFKFDVILYMDIEIWPIYKYFIRMEQFIFKIKRSVGWSGKDNAIMMKLHLTSTKIFYN